jgi:hypothetical protein
MRDIWLFSLLSSPLSLNFFGPWASSLSLLHDLNGPLSWFSITGYQPSILLRAFLMRYLISAAESHL